MNLKSLLQKSKTKALIYIIINYIISIVTLYICEKIEFPLIETYLINIMYVLDISLIFMAFIALIEKYFKI